MDPTKLIAVGVAEIGELDRTHRRSLARAWRGLDRGAAIGNRGIVKLLHLLRGVARKGDGTSVRDGRWFIVDRLADDEVCSVATIVDEPGVAAVGDISHRFTDADRAEHRIVEAL